MTALPEAFTDYTRQLMGEERFERYLQSFEEPTPVSIRLNPMKSADLEPVDGEPVAWCRGGYYLHQRPSFTFDPLLHAGCYYVQEAASMFLDEVLRQTIGSQLSNGEIDQLSKGRCLDLCAAPGGKSTLLRAALPEDCVLYSNEPVRQRACILAENVSKWGYDNHIVTNNYPRDYRASKLSFDVILCDVPCSGEGMFRKDATTINEWSLQNVEKCWQLQREIIDDAWACLRPGGMLIYSTCTFNTMENEENIQYFLEKYDAELVPINIRPEWHITGSLLKDFEEPVYRFIPGVSRSEGLFLCVLRKHGGKPQEGKAKKDVLHVMKNDNRLQTADIQVELTYPQALAYLRHEALQLPEDAPRGLVNVCFQGHPLGMVKNIGSRANNLYPKEWKIKTTHIPNDYETILRHT